HVAEIGAIDFRVDFLHKMLVVDIAAHGCLVVPHERDDVVMLAAHRLGSNGGISCQRRSDKAVRQHPDFQLLDPWRVRTNDDRLRLRLLADYRLQAAPTWRVLSLQTDAIDFRRWGPKVDRARVRLVDESGPG